MIGLRGGEHHFRTIGLLPPRYGRLERRPVAQGSGHGQSIIRHAEHCPQQYQLAYPTVHGKVGQVHAQRSHGLGPGLRIDGQGLQELELVYGPPE